MIALLEGTLAEVLADGAVVLAGGVGYRALMPASAIARLPGRGTRVRLHTHLHVRDDALTLFGFPTAEERDLFEVLLGVSGLGPKGALALLAVHAPAGLRAAIAGEDLDALTRVPGIGRKTAARLVVDLRERLGAPDAEGVPGGTAERRAALGEVRGALLALGYSPGEAREALERLPEDGTVEELVRLALKEMART